MAATDNGTLQQPVTSWDDAASDVRDMGLKYMNAALNAASGQTGGVVRNTFNLPAATASPTTPSSAGTSPAAGLLSSPILKGVLLGLGGPALLAAGSLLPGVLANKPTVPVVNPPAVVQPDDDNIGVKADLLVDPPGATQ